MQLISGDLWNPSRLPHHDRTGIIQTDVGKVVIIQMIWTLNERWQALTGVVSLGQHRAQLPCVNGTRPGGYDSWSSHLYPYSLVAHIRIQQGMRCWPTIMTSRTHWTLQSRTDNINRLLNHWNTLRFDNQSSPSAKCKPLWQLHTSLPDTPVNCVSSSKYVQVCHGPPGAHQGALKLYRKILRFYWKHLQLSRSIQDDPSRIFKFSSSGDLDASPWEISSAAVAAVQICGRLGTVFSQLLLLEFHNYKAFHLSNSSFLRLHDWLHHNMACIIYLSDTINIHTVNRRADGTWA
jgi:hypothetical protein